MSRIARRNEARSSSLNLHPSPGVEASASVEQHLAMDDLDSDIAEAWRAAAEDLGLQVVAPVEVGKLTAVARVNNFGGPNGVIMLRLGGQHNDEVVRAAEADGYYVSLVNGDSYRTYDRKLFIDTLDDWGWFGEPEPPPRWYTGTAWGS